MQEAAKHGLQDSLVELVNGGGNAAQKGAEASGEDHNPVRMACTAGGAHSDAGTRIRVRLTAAHAAAKPADMPGWQGTLQRL